MFFLQACGPGQRRVEELEGEASQAYSLCQAPFLPAGIGLKARLDTTAEDRLSLHLQLQNNSGEELKIQLGKASLLTDDERRQQPLLTEEPLTSIPPNATKELVLHYQPVNDLYLYQRSGLHGPWQQQYRLPLSFVQDLSDTLSFCFRQEAYLQYVQESEQNKPRLYRPSVSLTTREAAARQEAYWKSLFEVAHDREAGASAYFTDQEFFSSGINLRHALYAIGDSLYLKLQLINHAPLRLEIRPDSIWLQTKGQVYRPVKVRGTDAQESLLLQRGDRLPLLLVYAAPVSDSLLLRLHGIKLHQFNQPLFREDFMFVQE